DPGSDIALQRPNIPGCLQVQCKRCFVAQARIQPCKTSSLSGPCPTNPPRVFENVLPERAGIAPDHASSCFGQYSIADVEVTDTQPSIRRHKMTTDQPTKGPISGWNPSDKQVASGRDR